MKAPRHGGIVPLVSVLCNRVMDQDVDATPLCAHCIVNKKLLSTSLSFFFFPFFFFSIINQIINHYTCYSVTNKLKIPLLRDEFSFSRHVVASLISKTFRISIVLRISWMVRRKFVIFFQSISPLVHRLNGSRRISQKKSLFSNPIMLLFNMEECLPAEIETSPSFIPILSEKMADRFHI